MKGKIKAFFIEGGRKEAYKDRKRIKGLQARLNNLYKLANGGHDVGADINEIK